MNDVTAMECSLPDPLCPRRSRSSLLPPFNPCQFLSRHHLSLITMRAVLGLGRRVAQLVRGPSASRASRGLFFRSPSTRRSSCFRRPTAVSKEEHNTHQAEYFAKALPIMQQSVTPEVHQALQEIADSVPGLSATSRVLDAGCGDGILIPHLQARGVADILAVDVTPEMVEALQQRLGSPSTLGNEPCVRTWVGDVNDLPNYQGPFDAIFFNSVFGNLLDEHAALTKACFLLRPGGHLVVSHPLGRAWHEQYRRENPDIVPGVLPLEGQWEELLHDLPLRLLRFEDREGLYLAVLRVPEGYALPQGPLYLSGPVVTGFGRGSRQLGVPTANLDPVPLAEQLKSLPAGVYFGWARLEAREGMPAADGQVHKMVMNIGRRPTFNDKEPNTSVELHVMHSYGEDFYGRTLKAVAVGYIRPELKFTSLDGLLARINTDIGIARSQLDQPQWQAFKNDPALL